MKAEIIDGYEVTVTDTTEFLTEVEEAALLLIDPSYFGAVPQFQSLDSSLIMALNTAVSGDHEAIPKWKRSDAVKRPSQQMVRDVARLDENELRDLLRRLSKCWGSMHLVRLRCGEFYSGTALNYFSHFLGIWSQHQNI